MFCRVVGPLKQPNALPPPCVLNHQHGARRCLEGATSHCTSAWPVGQYSLSRRWGASVASSQFKGVHWRSPPGAWQVLIYDPRTKRRRNLGFFDDECEAAKAYDAALALLQKAAPEQMAAIGMRAGSVRARTNFPRGSTRPNRSFAARRPRPAGSESLNGNHYDYCVAEEEHPCHDVADSDEGCGRMDQETGHSK